MYFSLKNRTKINWIDVQIVSRTYCQYVLETIWTLIQLIFYWAEIHFVPKRRGRRELRSFQFEKMNRTSIELMFNLFQYSKIMLHAFSLSIFWFFLMLIGEWKQWAKDFGRLVGPAIWRGQEARIGVVVGPQSGESQGTPTPFCIGRSIRGIRKAKYVWPLLQLSAKQKSLSDTMFSVNRCDSCAFS